MAWPTLVAPTAGTVITVAREVAMNNDPLNWLRLLTGNADPPAAHYVVVSTGPASTAWGKVSADELGPGAAVGNIGYTPLDRAGDTTQGDLTVSRQTSHGLPADGVLFLGQSGGNAYILRQSGIIYIGNASQTFVVQCPTTHASTTTLSGATTANAAVTINGANLTVNGDVLASRPSAPTTGYIFFAGHFLGFDGTKLIFDNETVWHSGNDGAGSGLAADTAATAANAAQLGSVAAAGYPTLAGGGNFTTRPTYGGDALAIVQSGTFSGSNSSSRQITTGFVPRYVRLTGVNASNTVVMQDIMSATPALNVQIAGTLSSQVITNVGTTALHASDGFVVSAVDLTDASGYSYSWVAFG